MGRCHQEGVSIAGIYYTHGLKCAKYPAQFIVFVGVVTIICSLPFFITTSGDINSPKPWRSPWLNYRLPVIAGNEDEGVVNGRGQGPASDWIINNPLLMSVRTPIWFLGLPTVIFQQIYVNVKLDCEHFVDLCQNSQQHLLSKKTTALMIDSLLTAERSCGPVMHPTVSKFAHLHGDKDTPLPPFIASILSPLLDNLQQRDSAPQSLRANISVQTTKELFFGGFWETSHKYSTNKKSSKSRDQTFAITLALQPTIENFNQITECVDTLNTIWPMDDNDVPFMKHIYYESEWTITNFAPLICLYSIVFLYISFSVGKIDLVRSKLGLGFTAVITVICSLTMSLGICTFFGLSITVSGSEIFPFVVVVIGLENILIITKAVISTDSGLDVKYRIAEGLGKEGRALTKNLLTILCLVILGIFTFNYAMKEFCIIALVGLLCDYFLHITFFTTVLSIDLRRMELAELSFHANKITQSIEPTEKIWRIPKRERVNNFLVRNRFAQRFFAVVLFIYFMSVISHTERFHSFVSTVVMPTSPQSSEPPNFPGNDYKIPIPNPSDKADVYSDINHNPSQTEQNIKDFINNILGPDFSRGQDNHVSFRSDEDGFAVYCEDDSYCWRPMVTTHWPRLLKLYNVTLEKRFITVLPPIMLNHRLGFSTQKLFAKTSHSKDLVAALSDIMMTLVSIPNVVRGIVLQLMSGIVIVYILVLCSEASHMKKKEEMKEKETQRLTTVFKLSGHVQDIECLSIDDGCIVTASLDGMVYVWDIGKRQCSTMIDRKELRLRDYRDTMSRHVEGCESSDMKSNSPLTPSTSSLSSLQNSSVYNKPHPPPPSHALSHQSIPPLIPPISISLIPSSTSTPTTIFPVHLPQKIIPGFLKRLSMPTILRRSPEKPEKLNNEGGDSGLTETTSETSSLLLPSSPLIPQSTQSLSQSSRPLRHSFSVPLNTSRSSSLSSLNSTKAVTTYSRPLVSHTEMSTGSKRSARSLSIDSSNTGTGAVACSTEKTSMSNWSGESLSLVSGDNSDLSYGTPETGSSPLPPAKNDIGFQFARHFSFYSQFTSELALMHCPNSVDELWETYMPSSVWCIDVFNGTIVIGCGNGQIEAWSISTGSLKFCLSLDLPGVTIIKAHPIGIISGHLDGSLQLTGHHGQLMHGVIAHRHPVTALCYSGDCVISGGYDGAVKIYRISDFMFIRSLTVHTGNIVTLKLVESELCLSACSLGIVCLWEYKTAHIVQEIDCRGSEDNNKKDGGPPFGIIKACCNANNIITLLRDNKVQIWNRDDGWLSNVIEMGMYTHDISILSRRHFAIALQTEIIIYDIISRREVTRKDLNSIGMPIVRHLISLEPSMLICTTGREVQLIPTGLKSKME